MNPLRLCLLLLLLVVSSFSGASASEPMQGCLKANDNCPAVISIKKKTNPDQLTLKPGEDYRITARNRDKDATHYQLSFANNDRPQRWVSISCGEYVAQCGLSKPSSNTNTNGKKFLLAVSWQAAFCELNNQKPECRSQTETRFDANYFSLHGLWPQPRNNTYCGVSESDRSIDRRGRWDLLPDAQISSATMRELREVMPGVASELHEHEWTKHGTCYSSDADQYYADSIRALDMLNQSPLPTLFTDNLNGRVSVKEIQQLFDQHYGKGSGEKVGVRCDRKNNINELWINLKGDLASDDLSNLLSGGDQGNSNCQSGSGKIDAVGSASDNWFVSWFRSLF